jgi:hypothetical protein
VQIYEQAAGRDKDNSSKIDWENKIYRMERLNLKEEKSPGHKRSE